MAAGMWFGIRPKKMSSVLKSQNLILFKNIASIPNMSEVKFVVLGRWFIL